MSLRMRAPVRLACGAFAAVLLCSASSLAFAAPGDRANSATVAELRVELERERAARAQADARLQALAERLAALEQTTQGLVEAQGSNNEQVATLATTVETLNAAPTVAVGNGRPTFATRDGVFTASLRANVMADSGAYFQDDPGNAATTDFRRGGGAEVAQARDLNSGVVLRRARLGLEGRVFRDFTYNLVTEFGGSGVEEAGRIFEMSLQYNGIPNVAIKAGAFEQQVGLGANVSTSNIMLMERPAVAEITRNIAAGDSRIGLQVSRWGEFGGDTSFGGSYMIAGGVTSSTASTGGSFGDQAGLTGRMTITPTPSPDLLFHVGLNGSYVISPQDVSGPSSTGPNPAGSYPTRFRDRPELRLDAIRLVDTGNIDSDHAWHWGLEGAFQYRNFMIQGEYMAFGVDRRDSVLSDPDFSGWYVEGAWVITGEKRRYNVQNAVFDAPSISNPWAPGSGGYGAWELAARYSTVNLNYNEGLPLAAIPVDGIRGGEQSIVTVGLNWYVNPSLRFMLQVMHVDIDRLAPTANYGIAGTPLGAQVGQEYDAVALRTQFGF